MKSISLSLLGIFIFLISAYITYALGMMNETNISRYIAIMGLVPIFIHVMLWVLFSYFPRFHKPYYVWGECLFVIIYWMLGFIAFSISFDISLVGALILIVPQVTCGLVFYILGELRFCSRDEGIKAMKEIRIENNNVTIKNNGVVMHYSYSKKFEWRWLEKAYSIGKKAFSFLIIVLFMFGGGAGLFMVYIIEYSNIASNGFGAHGLVIYLLSFICIAVMSFGIPMVKFNYQWWKSIDKRIRKEHGSVQYNWPMN